MAHEQHEHEAIDVAVHAAVVTVSDHRTTETDVSGELIASLLMQHGCSVDMRRLVRNEPDQISEALTDAQGLADVNLIIFTGGTGLSHRDQTIDTVSERFDRAIPGFGDLFRTVSYREIGSAAWRSRAEAGVISGKLVLCLPGSTAAVRTALEQLLLPQMKHAIWDIRR